MDVALQEPTDHAHGFAYFNQVGYCYLEAIDLLSLLIQKLFAKEQIETIVFELSL
jgi:hypothetical protein